MLEDERETLQSKDAMSWKSSPLARIGGGILAAFLLQYALESGMAMVALPLEHALGYMRDLPDPPNSIAWFVVFSVGAAFAWRLLRPSAKVWTVCFALFSCLWFLSMIGRADTQEQQLGMDMGKAMFLLSVMVTVVGIVRVTLGEGRQQQKALKELIDGPVPQSAEMPQESLLRASSRPETPHNTLLRPARDTQESAPEQLLRASRIEDQPNNLG